MELIRNLTAEEVDRNTIFTGQSVIGFSDRTIEGKTFTNACGALEMHPDGKPYHTFRTATLLVNGKNLSFKNCIFENTAGSGKTAGQALALYCDGDGLEFSDCTLRGFQDTLFLAPLPPKEIQKDGFIGPGQVKPRTPRHVVFRHCYIEGSVDFIFGGAWGEFFDCEFRSLEPGYVFAPSTPEGQEHGMVATNCTFTAAPGLPERSVYLGRPWRDYARCELIDCTMGSHIKTEGWSDWNKPAARENAYFYERGSKGPGASKERDSFVHVE